MLKRHLFVWLTATSGGALLTLLAFLLFYRCDMPQSLTISQLLQRMIVDWITCEDWSQRSINYTAGTVRGALFHPVAMVGVWVFLSALLHAMWQPPRRLTTHSLQPYVALLLIGWLLLDLRWQWDITQRLLYTADQFSGKDEAARRLAAQDGAVYQFASDIRAHLPMQPVRLISISANPTDFIAGRTRYHLLPHNSTTLDHLPQPHQVQAGNYLLLISPLKGVQYDAASQQLRQDDVQLPATSVHTTVGGTLFRVNGH